MMRHNRARSITLALAAGLVAALSGCGSSDSAAPTAPSGVGFPLVKFIQISGGNGAPFLVRPATETFSVTGGSMAFLNWPVFSLQNCPCRIEFDHGFMAPRPIVSSSDVAFMYVEMWAGVYRYTSYRHDGGATMRGTVIVVGR